MYLSIETLACQKTLFFSRANGCEYHKSESNAFHFHSIFVMHCQQTHLPITSVAHRRIMSGSNEGVELILCVSQHQVTTYNTLISLFIGFTVQSRYLIKCLVRVCVCISLQGRRSCAFSDVIGKTLVGPLYFDFNPCNCQWILFSLFFSSIKIPVDHQQCVLTRDYKVGKRQSVKQLRRRDDSGKNASDCPTDMPKHSQNKTSCSFSPLVSGVLCKIASPCLKFGLQPFEMIPY